MTSSYIAAPSTYTVERHPGTLFSGVFEDSGKLLTSSVDCAMYNNCLYRICSSWIEANASVTLFNSGVIPKSCSFSVAVTVVVAHDGFNDDDRKILDDDDEEVFLCFCWQGAATVFGETKAVAIDTVRDSNKLASVTNSKNKLILIGIVIVELCSGLRL